MNTRNIAINKRGNYEYRYRSRRIAINVGAGYVPGINAVIAGRRPGGRQIWDGSLSASAMGLKDCFIPERYPDGGLVTLSPQLIENLDPAARGYPGPIGPDRSV